MEHTIQDYLAAIEKGNEYAMNNLTVITTPLKRYKLYMEKNIKYEEPKTKEIKLYENKVKYTSKELKCCVCLYTKKCILLGCFAHYICVDCYVELYDKPCPVCRL